MHTSLKSKIYIDNLKFHSLVLLEKQAIILKVEFPAY